MIGSLGAAAAAVLAASAS
ncbi:MAG: hypothetical protein AB8E82_16595 [Aureispira sp.]